jgi:hypothetical protein
MNGPQKYKSAVWNMMGRGNCDAIEIMVFSRRIYSRFRQYSRELIMNKDTDNGNQRKSVIHAVNLTRVPLFVVFSPTCISDRHQWNRMKQNPECFVLAC